jgi:hypothetical protein
MTDHLLQQKRITKLRSSLRDKNLNCEDRRRLRNKLSWEIFEAGKPQAHALPITRDAMVEDER